MTRGSDLVRSAGIGVATAAAFVLLAAGVTSPLAAQSTITSSGLGYPVPPIDARAAALGSGGVGLLGGRLGATFSIRNPAELTQHEYPGVSVSLAPEGVTLKNPGGASHHTGRSRIGVIRAVVPLRGWAVSFGFGPELDQDWAVTIQDTLEASIGDIPFEERRTTDGGISAVDLSVARRIGQLSVGAGVQRLTGSVRQTFLRQFDALPDPAVPLLADVADARIFAYGGWRFKGGVSLDTDRFMLGGSFGLSGDLSVDPQGEAAVIGDSIVVDTLGVVTSVPMPNSVEVGGSLLVTRSIMFAAGGGWAGYSSMDGVGSLNAYDTMWGGLGVEVHSLRAGGLSLPLRLGGRFAQLPFSVIEDNQVSERALAIGVGAVFREGAAAFDATFEFGNRGNRETDGLEETFRRLTLTFTLRQGLQRPLVAPGTR